MLLKEDPEESVKSLKLLSRSLSVSGRVLSAPVAMIGNTDSADDQVRRLDVPYREESSMTASGFKRHLKTDLEDVFRGLGSLGFRMNVCFEASKVPLSWW